MAARYQTPSNGAKDSPPTDPGNALPPVEIEAVNAKAAIEAGKRDIDAAIDSLEDH